MLVWGLLWIDYSDIGVQQIASGPGINNPLLSSDVYRISTSQSAQDLSRCNLPPQTVDPFWYRAAICHIAMREMTLLSYFGFWYLHTDAACTNNIIARRSAALQRQNSGSSTKIN